MSQLPSFLIPRRPPYLASSSYTDATFIHSSTLGFSHTLWWPARSAEPETIILFIPGNPGLLDFYITFLTAIHDKDTTSKLAILAHSHVGHTPGIEPEDVFTKLPVSRYGLTAQVKASLEVFDAIRSTFDPQSRVIVIGHSVGAWLSLQILEARPLVISTLILLFPTISHIKDTPNGRSIYWLFTPCVRSFIYWLSYLIRLLPTGLLSILYRDWPLSQLYVLRTFLHSPTSIYAALYMAHDEMKTIQGLDLYLLNAHREKLRFYFAKQDNWVGEQKYDILHSFEGDVNVVHGRQGIPHAFCINHGEQLAQQCHLWLDGNAVR